ncbi:hypothetical protein BKA63DRAFT_1402 [Paraphoma chrysanthemicola]|nr:hypothetical protein BKA63DRAFT_1402 [Paraphoma chrysanthemicola]
MLYALIDACIAQGVPVDQDDVSGRTPVVLWQTHMSRLLFDAGTEDPVVDFCREVLMRLIRTLDIWTVIPYDYFFNNAAIKYYEVVSDILSMDEFNSSLVEDDPLVRAILERSETQVASFLNVAKVAGWASLVNRGLLINAIACWPNAVQLIIQSGLFQPSEDVVVKIWDAAIIFHEWDTLQILLDFGVRVTWEDWEKRNWFHRAKAHYPASQQETVDQVVKVYRSMATQFLRHSRALIRSPSTGSIDNLVVPSSQELQNLYHASDLTVEGAEGAWLAGLRDLNSISGIGVTPLWNSVSDLYVQWNYMLPSARWLIKHGADLTWVHPVYLTIPAHIIIRRSVAGTCLKFAEDEANSKHRSLSYLEPITQVCELLLGAEHLYQNDKCVCHCSRDGCSIFSCAVSISNVCFGRYFWVEKPKPEEYTYHRKTILPYLFSLFDRVDQPYRMASSVLRVLTFEELHLPHTCCYRVLDETRSWCHFKRPTPEEAMHDTDPRDLELLEMLMDEFEAKWNTYKRPFATFIKRVWKPRMRQIRREREVNQEIYEADLIRIGVILNDNVEEKLEAGCDLETEYDSNFELDWGSKTSSEDSDSESESEDDGYEKADEEV